MKMALPGSSRGILVALTFTVATALLIEADQIEMQNGDRYTGKVLSLESNTVVMKSDVLGTLRIRRDRVAGISLGDKPQATAPATTAPATTVPQPPPVPTTSGSPGPGPTVDLNSSLSESIAAHPDLVSEIRGQVLAGAGPKAVAKYDAIIRGLSDGSFNLADLRKEAASVAAQLRELRGSGDGESAALFDEYLSVLDSFLNETETATPQPAPSKPDPKTD